MLDDSLDALSSVREGPVWRPVPEDIKAQIGEPVPRLPAQLEAVYTQYQSLIEPYANGNRHPRFFGWVHGNGTPSGALAEMLAAVLNANLGGREHSAVYVERAVISWCTEIFGFPPTASGILTSGTSLANFIAVLVARYRVMGADVRESGLRARPLVAYASADVHRCVPDAFDMAGLGRNAVRLVATDARYRIDTKKLRVAIASDRQRGCEPFMVVATAGTVNTGAIDDLKEIADICVSERLWLHVDGAFGALAMLSREQRALLSGIEAADSLAFDFHKWLHVPYDAGCVLIRDRALHAATFASSAPYLAPAATGTGAGAPWFADYGPELSRRFRALAIWFAFKEHGVDRLGAAIAENCRQATRLGARITQTANLRLVAPVALNIVCFRYDDCRVSAEQIDAANSALVVELQHDGIAVPSTTLIDGRIAIRLNLTNHRVTDADLDMVLAAVVDHAQRLLREAGSLIDA